MISALTSDPLNLESSPPFRILPPIVIPTEAGIQKCFRAVPINPTPGCAEDLSLCRILPNSMISGQEDGLATQNAGFPPARE